MYHHRRAARDKYAEALAVAPDYAYALAGMASTMTPAPKLPDICVERLYLQLAERAQVHVPDRTAEEQDPPDTPMWNRSQIIKALRSALQKDPECARCYACVYRLTSAQGAMPVFITSRVRKVLCLCLSPHECARCYACVYRLTSAHGAMPVFIASRVPKIFLSCSMSSSIRLHNQFLALDLPKRISCTTRVQVVDVVLMHVSRALLMLGENLAQDGRNDDAEKVFARALQLFPTSTRAAEGIGATLKVTAKWAHTFVRILI